MTDVAVRLKGQREVQRALNRVDKAASRDLKRWLKEAAQPAAEDAKARLSRFVGVSLATIKPSATMRGVSVRQNARSVTGLRPDFGGLIMREGLIPAAWSRLDDTIRGVEVALDRLSEREGF